MRVTTITDIKRLRDLASPRLSRASVARCAGMNPSTVRYWDRKERLGLCRIVRRQTTSDDLARLRAAAAYGTSSADIARATGMDRQSVRYWSRKLGLTFAERTVAPIFADR
jgi:hypothetical protein